jgi:ataxin-10
MLNLEIVLLRLLDIFLPRISLGKVASPGVAGPQSAAATGFPYVKRDLVRLLGILAHNERTVQDRVRACNGIPTVMNMCVIDDLNPCTFHLPFLPLVAVTHYACKDLREHAIFALRNLLQGNKENQEVVDSIKPTGVWDEEGILRDRPGAVRR